MKKGREIRIALVTGDGAAPEMMATACAVVVEAAKRDDIAVNFEETPMGWNAFEKHGDTLPEDSLRRATEIGTIFFGGVGDTELDKTLGVRHPDLMPEARALLALRKKMGLLLNFRPVTYYKALDHLYLVRPEQIPVSARRTGRMPSNRRFIGSFPKDTGLRISRGLSISRERSSALQLWGKRS